MITELTFNGRIVGMNGSGGLLRMHWTKKRKLKDMFTFSVRSQTMNRHAGKVKLELVRHSSGIEMDYDNLVSTGKILIDSIVSAGVIKDDKKLIVAERNYSQVKCKMADQKTVIIISDL